MVDPDGIAGPPDRPERHADVTRGAALALGLVVFGLVVWTGYLAWTLPERYEARNWNVLWVGFDAALVVVLGYAAWVAWFERRIMVVTALVAGTLLLCDAWFDVVTSIGNRDAWLTVLTAALGELPAAFFLFFVAHRILSRLVSTVHALSGLEGPAPRIRDATELHATGQPAEDEPASVGADAAPGAPEAGRA